MRTGNVVIDCDSCAARGRGCAGCFVAVLLDPGPSLTADESRALDVLQSAGLIGPRHLAVIRLPGGGPAAGAPVSPPGRSAVDSHRHSA